MYPGEMQFTRIPVLAHSMLREAARCRTAALEALYGLVIAGRVSQFLKFIMIRTRGLLLTPAVEGR